MTGIETFIITPILEDWITGRQQRFLVTEDDINNIAEKMLKTDPKMIRVEIERVERVKVIQR